MFSARLTGHQGIPAATFVAGAVALATLTAACGSAGSSSSTTAVQATAGTHAAGGVRAVTSAPAAVGKTAGQAVDKAAGASRAASGSTTAGASEPASVSRPAGHATKSPGAGSLAGTGKLTGAGAAALLSKAIANTQAASSVRVTGEAVSGSTGQTETFDLTLVRDVGCQGAIALSPAKSFKIVEAEGYLWMLPSRAYYESMHMSKQQMAQVEDKYVRVSASGQQASQMAAVCTFSGLLGQFGQPGGAPYLAVPASHGGHAGYRVTGAGQPGTAFVTKASAPRLLEVAGLQPNHRSITFAAYNVTRTITVPTAAETIDGSSQ
jgi:hypothetical protein